MGLSKEKQLRYRHQDGNYKRERGQVEVEGGEGGYLAMERNYTLGGEHTMQYTDDVLWNCVPEACIPILTNVTPINSIKSITC